MAALDVITQAVELACRAPSLHNSQPWRWVIEGAVVSLFADQSRIGHATDSTGREVLISCGAALNHLSVAMAASGWDTYIDRFPSPNNRDHLASMDFRRVDFVTDAERARGGDPPAANRSPPVRRADAVGFLRARAAVRGG